MTGPWLDGIWSGTGYQKEGVIWTIRLTVDRSCDQYQIQYPSVSEAQGRWILVEEDRASERYVFDEIFDKPNPSLVNLGRVIVTRVTDNHMSFSFFNPSDPQNVSAWSTLQREQY